MANKKDSCFVEKSEDFFVSFIIFLFCISFVSSFLSIRLLIESATLPLTFWSENGSPHLPPLFFLHFSLILGVFRFTTTIISIKPPRGLLFSSVSLVLLLK